MRAPRLLVTAKRAAPIVPMSATVRMLLTADMADAAEARRLGLVNDMVEAGGARLLEVNGVVRVVEDRRVGGLLRRVSRAIVATGSEP